MVKLDKEISDLLQRLPESEQQKVLEFARELADVRLHGVPGSDLISFGGAINPDDLQQMRDAIESGCEAVNLSEW
jgi:hypothetical protein